MSLYQQSPLEGPRQLGSPWGPEREKKKWFSRFNKRNLLVGLGVYLLLNLAYFLLTALTPYDLVPWLRQLVWIFFWIFCLGAWFFLLIGLALLMIKLVRQEPKRNLLYALLCLLGYIPFAWGMFYLLIAGAVLALFSIAAVLSWDGYSRDGEVYYELNPNIWASSYSCYVVRQENLIFTYSLGLETCQERLNTYYLTDAPEAETGPSALPSEFEYLDRVPLPLADPQSLEPGEKILVEEEKLSYLNQQHGVGALVVGSNQVYSATYQASEGIWQLGGEINNSIGARDLEVCGMLRLPAENLIAYCQADERGARIYSTADEGASWQLLETGRPPEASYLLDAYQEEDGLYVLELGYPAWVNSSVTSKLTSPDGVTWTKE